MSTSEQAAGSPALSSGWRRRGRKYEPWLLGLAGFLLTSAGLLHNAAESAGTGIPAMALHLSGLAAG